MACPLSAMVLWLRELVGGTVERERACGEVLEHRKTHCGAILGLFTGFRHRGPVFALRGRESPFPRVLRPFMFIGSFFYGFTAKEKRF